VSEYEYEAPLDDDGWAFDEDTGDDFETEDDVRVVMASSIVAEWERQNGIELSDEDFDRVAAQVDAYGVDPGTAYGATDDGRFEEDFEATIEAVEREQGRTLLQSEVEAMWDAASAASEDPSVATNAEMFAKAREAVPDMLDTSDGMAEYIGQRLAVPQEREEASAVQVGEDGDEFPSYNLDNTAELESAIDAALSGEAVATHDNDDIESDDE